MPERMNLRQARNFLKEVQPFLTSDRPQVVFDMSQVRHIDAAGVDVLLQCMRAAMKHDGDLKLAALSPHAAIVLELTRTGRLFEIYESSTAAVKSFSSFLPNAIRNSYSPLEIVSVAAPDPLAMPIQDEEPEGAGLAA